MSSIAYHSGASQNDEAARLRAEVARLSGEMGALRERIAELETACQEDALTKLLNRRGFLRDLDRAIAFSRRYNAPAALLILDLDAFKPINDRWGHVVGDKALLHVAGLLRDNLRSSDSIARLGGDEFAILLWQVDAEVARQKADALEAILASTPLALANSTVRVAGSIGSTPLLEGDDCTTAIARADAEMYARKKARAAAGGLRR
jgi:diguanylate cyclase (GGDEF)-like protein